jgi:hypothetical protein
MIVFYLSTVHKLTGHAPMRYLLIDPQQDNCEKYWWATLLYIVNYYKSVETQVSKNRSFRNRKILCNYTF